MTAREIRQHLADQHGLNSWGRDYGTLVYLHLAEHDADPDIGHTHEEEDR